MLSQVKALLEKGDIPSAEKLLVQVTDKNNPLYHLYYGVVYAQNGNLAAAVSSQEKAIELDVELSAAHVNLAKLYHLMGDKRAREKTIEATWLECKDESLFTMMKDLGYPTYKPAEVVFYTGTPYLEKKFSPQSLDEEGLGGSETAFIMMAKKLAEKGIKVLCFCNTPETKEYNGVTYVPVAQFFLYNKKFEIPVLIASRFLHPFVHKARAKKKILWIHETLGTATQENISPVLDQIDHILTLSDYQLHTVATRYSIPLQKFIKTRNGFIEEHYSKQDDGPRQKNIVYFSRPERGLDETLQVFSRLKKNHPDLTLTVCAYTQWNDLSHDPSLSLYAEKLKADGVIYKGGLPKKELARLLQHSLFCLYPNVSTAETSCIVAIESMAAGLPMVTSNRGALPETLGDAGVVIEFSKDEIFVDKLTKACESLLNDPDYLNKISARARTRAWDHYRWDAIADEWLSFIK